MKDVAQRAGFKGIPGHQDGGIKLRFRSGILCRALSDRNTAFVFGLATTMTRKAWQCREGPLLHDIGPQYRFRTDDIRFRS
jgi:hypothetical protein